MRLLVLSSSFPYPIDAGRKAVLAGFLDYAVTTLRAENVLLVCISSVDAEVGFASSAPCKVIFLNPASMFRRAALVALNSLMAGRRAIQEMLVAAPKAAPRIASIVDQFDPDIVLVDTIRMVQHMPPGARCTGRRCVLYLDDLYSLRYRRTLSVIHEHPEAAIDLIGTFDQFLPGPLRVLTRSHAVQRQLLEMEGTIMARREAAMPGQFDQVVLLNPDEAGWLARATGAKNVSAVMPLLRRTGSEEVVARRFTGDPTFLFLGNLRYPANSHGLWLFLQQAMPMFLARVPGGRLMVVGVGAGRELRRLGAGFGQRVSFLDYVEDEDLDALCSSAAGMVVPVLFGSGIKIKVIEALARGLPVIATRLGVDGLGLEPGRHCIVEEDLAGFADAMVRLLDRAVNDGFARRSFACYRERFAPEVVALAYRAALFGDRSPEPTRDRKSTLVMQSKRSQRPGAEFGGLRNWR